MLTIRQFQILNACANGFEVFYFPFAEVNFGGQVWSRAANPPHIGNLDIRSSRYLEDKEWTIQVPATEICADITILINADLLECWSPNESSRNRIRILHPSPDEFAVYKDYNCFTWEEHIDRYGVGPHEFKITAKGLKEIDKPEYEEYCRQLGWNNQ